MPPKKTPAKPPPKKKQVNVALFGGKGRVPGKRKKNKDIRGYLKMHGGLFTTIAAGGTTVAGQGAMPVRAADKFCIEVVEYLKEEIACEEKLMAYMEPGEEPADRKDDVTGMREKMDALEKKIGKMWISALPRYTKLDGNPLDLSSLPTNKPQPPPAGEDPAYELQWW